MSVSAEYRKKLLDLAAPAKMLGAASLATLDDAAWRAMWDMACAHRIEPLLHARLRDDETVIVPDWFRRDCSAAFHRRSLRNVQAQRELLLIKRDLDAAGIPFIAMKGAYLAFHAYEEAGMRPLRDLDILVARDQAMLAHRALLARGLMPLIEGGNVELVLKTKHQLPTLKSVETRTRVEVHHRAFHGDAGEPDLTDDPGFAARLIEREVGGQMLRFMGAEDLLLHLIVHSVYDHRFDNGPSILADIAALLGTHAIDWRLFWQLADGQEKTRGAIFALRMAQDYWGELPIGWQGHDEDARTIAEAVIEAAAVLSLRNLEGSADLALADAASGSGGTTRLIGKLFPSPTLLRGAYPNYGLRRELPGLYLRKWRDIAMTRLPSFTRQLRSSENGEDRAAMREVREWLDLAA